MADKITGEGLNFLFCFFANFGLLFLVFQFLEHTLICLGGVEDEHFVFIRDIS